MNIAGKVIGAVFGFILFRNVWGLIIGLFLGHLYDQGAAANRRRSPNPEDLGRVRERFFIATFEVMGYVAKSDGRVSEAEIAAARRIMGELRLDGAQIHAAIQHFTRGKSPGFDLEDTVRDFREICADQPEMLRAFLEFQVRASLEGVDMQGPARTAIQRIAELLDVSRFELAHIEAVLRLQREYYRQRAGASSGGRQGAGQPGPRPGMQLDAAYQVLEVDPKASNDQVSKAYRRQLSKHHPDKLKANGLPDSMLEHAKQRTQQIIEAFELIKAARGM